MIHRPQRYRVLMGFLLGLIISMIAFGTAYFYYLNHSRKISEQEKESIREAAIKNYEESHPKKLTYILNQDKVAGEVLTDADITATEINAGVVPVDAITEPSLAIGKVMRGDMKKNTIITKSLYYDEKEYPSDMRLMEYSIIDLPQKLEVNEYVDVRIMLPTGVDFIVLSKKRVVDLQNNTPDNSENIIWMYAEEKEILRMASAIVDASLIEGSIIYAVPYVAPDVQEDAIRTYPANIEVQSLILQDPNIIDKAVTELEVRRRKLFEKDINSSIEFAGGQKIFADGSAQELTDVSALAKEKEIEIDNKDNGIEGAL